MRVRTKAAGGTAAAVMAALLGISLLRPTSDTLIEGQEHTKDEDRVAAVFSGTVVETAATQDIMFRLGGKDYAGFPRSAILGAVGRTKDYLIRPKGGTWQGPFLRKVALQRLERKLDRGPLGERWQVKGKRKAVIFRVDTNPTAYLATVGTPAIDILVGTVVRRFPDVRNLGIFVCKRISGSSSWSQHAWANAVDFGGSGPWGSRENIELLDAIDSYVRDLTAQDYLDVSQFGWRNWAGHWPGHSHYSGAPLRTGTPPCAR